MSLKEEIKEIVKEFRTIDFEGMTLDELATDKELNELTDKILALEPFKKLERVKELCQNKIGFLEQRLDLKESVSQRLEGESDFANKILREILSENEKAGE